ncbi:hypothetical protein FHS18_004037 [Paenibacillus phyllosphaerae]|uniref:Uncharacterized protein n=1 Tax=Paenibacillus phyllosphaerae TaxID=274593 RepID=A0A7W5B0P0_9BACL|nr:hypothetical protein [Paenibacillus phyllosphaerae]MBB3111969.1 hypothetical protein [Paenibacillus phyllosphaerae]
MRWNHSEDKLVFGRRTCPICEGKIDGDWGRQSMEISVCCQGNEEHYSVFVNFFASSVTILGKDFDDEQVLEIESYLDQLLREHPEFFIGADGSRESKE